MRKKVLNVCFFFLVMGMTAYIVFRNSNLKKVVHALHGMNKLWLIPAALFAVFFVMCEAFMIYDLLHMMGHKCSLARCISYSFIGYFYSGITPSASGGQPMQLYYMRKDGNRTADSSVTLMTLTFFSRLVLSVIGFLLLIFHNKMLHEYFQGFIFIYYLGLILNTLTAAAFFAAMAAPGALYQIINRVEKILVRIHILKYSEKRQEKIISFIYGYKEAVAFLLRHKKEIVYLFLISFAQRISLYILTWFVCRGFGIRDAAFIKTTLLQAAIYVAVEMLPLPGSQGITELLYFNVFGAIMGRFLMPSMLVVRGIDFYFLMLIGLMFVLYRFFRKEPVPALQRSDQSSV